MIPRQKFSHRKFSRPRPERPRDGDTYEQRIKHLRTAIHDDGKKPRSNFANYFHTFSHKTSEIVGNPWAFTLAAMTILMWAILGPLFGFSDTWQLVINTATTIVTFLMVFLIQNTQNRDARAIHLKLDELLHAMKGARNRLIDLEDMSEEELDELQKEFEHYRQRKPRAHDSKKKDS